MRFPEGKLKALTLSYDDGVKADLRLAEILNKYGIKCTFNLNSGFMWEAGKATPDEFKEHILPHGHEIAVHGARHIAPGIGGPCATIDDVLTCRRELERTFDTIIRGLAYPDTGITKMHNGNTYEEVRAYLKALGIVYARSLRGDNDEFMLPTDFYAWIPTAHHQNPELMTYAEKFLSIKDEELRWSGRFPRLFYLWGHSYEFDNNQNWDRIEAFCQLLSGKEDIWYATNIEICEYCLAFRSLIMNVDRTKVYNPTLVKLWMDVDGKTYAIAPGETLMIP